MYLGTYIDDPEDEKYVSYVTSLCVSCCIERVHPAAKMMSVVRSLVSGAPVTNEYYRSEKLTQWVKGVVDKLGSVTVFCISTPMAQFLADIAAKVNYAVMDYVDVDSEKWTQLASEASWPLRWLFRREAKLLSSYENGIAAEFDKLLFVSEKESETFLLNNRIKEKSVGYLDKVRPKIDVLSNGVDAEFFNPDIGFYGVYPQDKQIIVFTGVMNYRPNEDAVIWFAEECFDSIKKACPDAVFYIVGARPSKSVLNLAKLDARIKVTGTVPDIRPYLSQAHVVVAPLRLGRGIQNKVLEALAMEKPLVASENALAGIDLRGNLENIMATGKQEFSQKVINILDKSQNSALLKSEATLGFSGRSYVIEFFSWNDRFQQMERMFKRDLPQ